MRRRSWCTRRTSTLTWKRRKSVGSRTTQILAKILQVARLWLTKFNLEQVEDSRDVGKPMCKQQEPNCKTDSKPLADSHEMTKDEFVPFCIRRNPSTSSYSQTLSPRIAPREVNSVCKVEHSESITQSPIGIGILKQDTRPDLIFHKCSFCHKISSRSKIMNTWTHYIHIGCLKMKVISNLISGKYKIYCHDKACKSPISRELIVPILNEKARLWYDVLEFLHELSIVDPEVHVYWCYCCRSFSALNSSQSSKWECCNKKQDKLKNVFTLLKLVLVDSKSMVKDFRNYNAIWKWVEDWRQYLQRCENCKQWKHNLSISALKCQWN